MNQLTEIDLFELLDLENLSEIEKKSFLIKISRIAIQQAVEKASKDGLIALEDLERISQEEKDPIKIQERLLEKCPSLLEYVQGSVNNMKIEILQKQIDETINNSTQSPLLDMTSALDLQSYLNKSTDEIDANILLEKIRLFRDLQNKILETKNGQQ